MTATALAALDQDTAGPENLGKPRLEADFRHPDFKSWTAAGQLSRLQFTTPAEVH